MAALGVMNQYWAVGTKLKGQLQSTDKAEDASGQQQSQDEMRESHGESGKHAFQVSDGA